jgi:hypothetical protein
MASLVDVKKPLPLSHNGGREIATKTAGVHALCKIILMVDDVESLAAGIESEFKVGGFARVVGIASRILWPAQHEFLDLSRVQGIGQ